MAESGNELQLIMALAAGVSARRAAEKAGFSPRTVQRRLRDDGFCREVARARGRIISRTTAMLARTSLRAVRTLDKLLDDENPAVKRMAARGVLDSLARISAQAEIEERIAGLENTLLGGSNDQEAITEIGNRAGADRWRRKEAEEEAATRRTVRQSVAAAGLRPVDSLDELSNEELDKYCRYHGFDYDGEQYEMPCPSWLVKERHGTMVPVAFQYCELQRGAITREEYHRRVFELAGLPVPADSPGGSLLPSAAVSTGSEAAGCELQGSGSSSGMVAS